LREVHDGQTDPSSDNANTRTATSGLPSSTHVAHGAGPWPPGQASEGKRQGCLATSLAIASEPGRLAAALPFFFFFFIYFF
jgi:hypothetical protein